MHTMDSANVWVTSKDAQHEQVSRAERCMLQLCGGEGGWKHTQQQERHEGRGGYQSRSNGSLKPDGECEQPEHDAACGVAGVGDWDGGAQQPLTTAKDIFEYGDLLLHLQLLCMGDVGVLDHVGQHLHAQKGLHMHMRCQLAVAHRQLSGKESVLQSIIENGAHVTRYVALACHDSSLPVGILSTPNESVHGRVVKRASDTVEDLTARTSPCGQQSSKAQAPPCTGRLLDLGPGLLRSLASDGT